MWYLKAWETTRFTEIIKRNLMMLNYYWQMTSLQENQHKVRENVLSFGKEAGAKIRALEENLPGFGGGRWID